MCYTATGAYIIRDDTALADRLTIDTSGNAGIGCVPTEKLDVNGNTKATYFIQTFGSGSVSYTTLGVIGGQAPITFTDLPSWGVCLMQNGTAPTTTVQIHAKNGNSIEYDYFLNQSLMTTSTPQFAKLGINQATGTEALEVAGNIKTANTGNCFISNAGTSSFGGVDHFVMQDGGVAKFSIGMLGSGGDFMLYNHTSPLQIINVSQSTNYMSINCPRVGINQAAGTEALEVNGNIIATGNIISGTTYSGETSLTVSGAITGTWKIYYYRFGEMVTIRWMDISGTVSTTDVVYATTLPVWLRPQSWVSILSIVRLYTNYVSSIGSIIINTNGTLAVLLAPAENFNSTHSPLTIFPGSVTYCLGYITP